MLWHSVHQVYTRLMDRTSTAYARTAYWVCMWVRMCIQAYGRVQEGLRVCSEVLGVRTVASHIDDSDHSAAIHSLACMLHNTSANDKRLYARTHEVCCRAHTAAFGMMVGAERETAKKFASTQVTRPATTKSISARKLGPLC
jgi:hypothetical protein